ncbi:MAG TPA: hypothetical protein PLV20_01015 [Anaerolineaceae bacterium]|jgi:hypothetical protein|nr:hypothetical protein [Anaerolineales bacterium]HOG58485.1 hypothetical protein [Anaerolineaceae bacterium]HOR83279.1 hypothetical protein [Anaerolineaceae bacterium]HOT52837.1 hypothetical protein [Anaerolineaceae bacterium]HPL43144.1 hypothetical protein [Anaerolineaceae bacterium]
MISLSVLFYVLLALFILIGAMRGFGKEIVVCASSVLALFTIEVVIPRIFGATSGAKRFWINTIVIVVCAFAGYQTPNLRRFAENIRFQRGAFRDILTGALMGGINGYILISSVWYYLAEANYPFKAITAPDLATEMGQNAAKILASAFPTYMHVPVIYYAMVIVFFLIIGAFV